MEDVRYPRSALEERVEGNVYVSFVVGTDGHPHDVTVVEPADRRLNRAARRAVRNQEFEPGRIDGTPVCVPMVTRATFQLR